MRRACLLLFCLISLPALAQPAAAPPRDRVITVRNRAPRKITMLLVSGANQDEWGLNRLGRSSLAPGRFVRVRLGRIRDCIYDLQVTYEDGRTEEKRDQDACHAGPFVFDATQAAFLADRTERAVVLLNRAPRPLSQVFISPSEATNWGDDLLPSGPLASGAEARLSYHGDCAIDLRVVFDNNSAEERRAVDLCGHPTFTIAPGWTTQNDPTRPFWPALAASLPALPVAARDIAGADRCLAPGP